VTRRIFIVEDEAIIAADLRRLVESFGYEVAGVAHNADAAAERIALSNPDLVLMDIRLGAGADGVDLAGVVGRTTPVVFLTAHGDPSTVSRASGTLPFGYVLKPFEEADLRAAIEVAFARAGAERELRAARDRAERTLADLPVGAVSTDVLHRVIALNPAAVEILGRPASEVLSRPFDEAVPIVDRASGAAMPDIAVRALVAGSARPSAGTAALATPAGRVPVDVLATRIADGDGNPTGCLVAFLPERSAPGRALVDNPLSPREREVLALLAEGLDAQAIAKQLGITLNTTRDHLKAIRRKLGARTQVEVLLTAIRRGLLT